MKIRRFLVNVYLLIHITKTYPNIYVLIIKGKSKKPFETSACIFLEHKRVKVTMDYCRDFKYECKHTYVDAFELTKRTIL